MANRSGQKGTKGETDRVRYLQARGWTYATRIPKRGARDRGDLVLDQAVPVMVESKETKAFTPSSFIAEMKAQIEHASAEFGFCIIKKRGTTDVGQYYALTTVEQQMNLIERVWKPSAPQEAVAVWQCGTYDEWGVCDVYAGHLEHGLPHSDSTNPKAFSGEERPRMKAFDVYIDEEEPPPRRRKLYTRR